MWYSDVTGWPLTLSCATSSNPTFPQQVAIDNQTGVSENVYCH